MCGRYTLYHDEEDLTALFELDVFPRVERYNIAPTQVVPVVREPPSGNREVLEARWGLVPRWVADPATFKATLFNARAETVAEKPSFRDAVRRTRCAVPASGFYEWKAVGGGKVPFYVHRLDGAPMILAGLYALRDDGSASATILTTRPNALMADLHQRMPVVLGRDDLGRWLDPDVRDAGAVADLLAPCPSEWLGYYPVGRAVGNPRVDDPSLIQRQSDDGG